MKTRAKVNLKQWLAVMIIALCMPLHGAYADLVIPDISGVVGIEGSDGDLLPAANVTIDLSLAVTGSWDSAGTGNGVYDPAKWAVVFKYNSINIPAGKTVTFSNHPSGAPVVWLVTGSVIIDGTVNLNGQNYTTNLYIPTKPGPGGFAGGKGLTGTPGFAGGGFGPGGANATNYTSASYASLGAGAAAGVLYGNQRIIPLIGGSGGGGEADYNRSGGAGGGALLIVASQNIAINGLIQALGGTGRTYFSDQVGGGSSGAIRLVADSIAGDGRLEAYARNGGAGRIRLETLSFSGLMNINPISPVNVPDEPLALWPTAAAPSLKVISIGAHDVPADPNGSPHTGELDFQMDNESISNIILEANNVPSDASVKVRIVPVNGNPVTETAIFNSGTDAVSTWVVSDVSLPVGPFVIQAHSINPTP